MFNCQLAKLICLESPVRSFAPHVLSTSPHISPANRLKYNPASSFHEQDHSRKLKSDFPKISLNSVENIGTFGAGFCRCKIPTENSCAQFDAPL